MNYCKAGRKENSMGNLRVINGKKSKKNTEPKYLKYARAVERFAEQYPNFNGEEREQLKIFTYLQVKLLSVEQHKKSEIEDMEILFSCYSSTTDLLALLTPREFMQMFPIEKEYDGNKYQTKDYFSTMEEINKLDIDQPIGEEKIMSFLWDYHNREIREFEVYKMCAMSDLRRMQGEKGIAEEFCEQNNISTYTHYEEQGILIENGTGKRIKFNPIKNRKPKYLNIL